ncbi:MAG: hypothetical protein WCB04_12715 [Mycobacteriales bacterium]
MAAMSAQELMRHVERLRSSVSVWSVGRWSAAPRPLPGLLPTSTSCAGVARHLVQLLADAGADAEGRARREVPDTGNDLVLADQILVLGRDFVLADPADDLRRAVLDEVLLHRAELDGARAGRDVLQRAAAACPLRRNP